MLLALAAAACKAPSQNRAQRPPVPVTMAPAHTADVPYTIVASGVVTPSQTATVAPQVDGIITHIAFREGQEVTRGQPLFQIEAQPYAAAYQQALASLARDRATAEYAQREALRYDSLERLSYATREQADQQRSAAQSAAATVLADSAAVSTARFNLDKTTIRAPIAGRTGSLLVHEGNLVHAAGSTPLVVIDELRPILVRFAVPGADLPLVQRYGAEGQLPVVAGSVSQGADSGAAGAAPATGGGDPPGDHATVAGEQGTLSFIDNAVDTTTGTVMLKASFVNEARRLWPGEFVTVTLRLFVERGALVVPTTAVLTGQQGTYVFVVDSSSTARQRPVQVERTAGAVAVIAQGVRAGERVISEGQSRVTPGAPVAERSAAAAPAGAAGNGGRGGSGGGRRRGGS